MGVVSMPEQSEQGASMSKIDLIIDALSISQNSIWSKLNEQALAAARELQALAQPEQKPVDIHCPSCLHSFSIVPVAKREWVGLHLNDMPETFVGDWSFLEGAKWAEAKLKEKNGG